MIKTLVVYESRYGNTRTAAEAIIEGMRQAAEVKAVLTEISKLDLEHIDWYDCILIGSPNHIGGPTRSIKKLLDKMETLGLDEKKGAFFDTCFAKDFGKAVRKMEKQLLKKAPQVELLLPGLSLKVEGMKGPLSAGEMDKCRAFGREIIVRINVCESI